MGTVSMVPFKLLRRLPGLLCALTLSANLLGEGWAALSGSTERIRQLIAKYDFPASDPVMDTQQQFIVFSPDQRLSRELLGEVIRLRQTIYLFFGTSRVWDQPAFILIFPTKEKYGLRGTAGAAIHFKYRGQYVRLIASYLQEKLRETILPHEMVHFLIKDLSTVGSARQDETPELPIFINEGIAEYFTAYEAKRVLFEKTVWETFQAKKLEPFKKIVTSTASWVEALRRGENPWVQRAQAYSVISFLASLPSGNVKLRNYILSYGTLANRVSPDSASLRAFEMAFQQDYASWQALQDRWIRYIRDREIVVIEAESASVTDSSGEKWEVRSSPKKKLLLSGGKELLFHAGKAGSFLTIHSTMPSPGAYDVYATYPRRPRAGQFRLALNGKEFPKIVDAYAREEEHSEPVYHGKALVPRGTMTLHFSVMGKQTISGGFEVGMDYLLFRRDRPLEERNKNLARRYLQAGTDHYRRRQFREAEADFTAAATLLPGNNAPALEWRAYVRMAMGKLDEAQQDVDAAVMLDPQNQSLTELRNRIEKAKRRP